jgi:hypothetical protein
LEREGTEEKLVDSPRLCEEAKAEFGRIRHFLEGYLANQRELIASA